MTERLAINGEVLRWAREEFGLSLEQAAQKSALTPDKLRQIESGELKPTLGQLEKFSSVYKRELLTFYLSTPPQKIDAGEDFRVLRQDHDQQQSGWIRALVRRIHHKQHVLAELCREAELPEIDFIGKMGPYQESRDIAGAADYLARQIKLNITAYRRKNSKKQGFKYVYELVQKAGVFVFQLSNLGSYHTDLSAEMFRGFALADAHAPCVVVNPKDSDAAKSFTLLHELVHLGIGASGISGDITGHSKAIEIFCNRVASEMLLDAGELDTIGQQIGQQVEQQKLYDNIVQLSGEYNISQQMIAFRLWQGGYINDDAWRAVKKQSQEDWEQFAQQQKEERKSNPENPTIPPKIMVTKAVGALTLELLKWGVREQHISSNKAAVVLDRNPEAAMKVLFA